MSDEDIQLRLQEQVLDAATDGHSLNIVGGNSKSFLGGEPRGDDALAVSSHRGIVSYEPKELVLTARCGTPLAEIETALAERGQMLGFEPPHFGAAATIGGTIAAGLSGPRRPYAGSARDFVLGVRLLNGRGEILRFGGEVMKNVAGYDLSRLVTGALGTLGVILDVSLKVVPRPAEEITLAQNRDTDDALRMMNDWARKPLPLSAACCDGERLYLRLSGAGTAVLAARKLLGGEVLQDGDAFWRERIREQGHAFFQGDTPLWRLSVPPATHAEKLPGKCLLDWGGAQRWLKSDADPASIREAAAAAGGHASCFRNGSQRGLYAHPLPASLMSLHRNLKLAFDPQRLFNPGRLYAEL